MTCIVGLVHKGKVFIGGDSAGVGGYDITIRKDVKVFKVGEFVIGCTTSFRMIQLIRFSFSPPKRHAGDDLYKYMCTSFVDALRSCFKAGGYTTIDKSVEFGGTFLVGVGDRLFSIMDDFQVAESADGFDTCGCGGSYALGALHAINKAAKPEERIKQALTIATHLSAGVRPPFVIEHT